MVAEFVQPDFTTQTAAEYKASIDAAINVLAELAANFAPHEASTPDMTVIVDAGKLLNGTLKTQQTSAIFTAPITDPRIDRIAINITTGNIVVIEGTEAASPVAPDYKSNQFPICQVALVISQTSILNSDIVDERPLIDSILGSDNTFIKTQRFTKGVDIASANDLVLLQDGNDNDITGTTDVNGMTDGIANEVRQFHADGIFTLKHNTAASAGFSSLHIVQGEADIPTAAGDEWKARYDGTVWRIFDYIRASSVPTLNAGLKTKIIDIGDWNMDTTSSVSVVHGLADEANIRLAEVMIIDDFGAVRNLLWGLGSTNTTPQGTLSLIDIIYVHMFRLTGGTFDGVNYDSTSYNRGWVTIQYVD